MEEICFQVGSMRSIQEANSTVLFFTLFVLFPPATIDLGDTGALINHYRYRKYKAHGVKMEYKNTQGVT